MESDQKEDPDAAEMAPMKSDGAPDEAAKATELEDVDLKDGDGDKKPQKLDVEEVVQPRSTTLG